MLRLELHEEAELELESEATYLEAERPGLARRFLTTFYEKCEVLCWHPHLGKRVGRLTRSLSMHSFHYNVIYMIVGETLFVVAIAPHRRRPGYWLDRLTNG